MRRGLVRGPQLGLQIGKHETKQLLTQWLQDSRFNLWQMELRKRSHKTASQYFKNLAYFYRYQGVTPLELKNFNAQQIQDWLHTWVLQMLPDNPDEDGAYCPKTVATYQAGVINWLKFNGIKVDPYTVPHTRSTPTLTGIASPLKAEVKQILDSSDPRQRSIASLIGFAGIRFQTQSKLKLKHLSNDGDFDINTLQFINRPAIIYLDPTTTKEDNPYRTLLIQEGCEYLEAYLRSRREKLTSESPVIASIDGKALKPERISQILQEVVKPINPKRRAYDLRSYFDWCILSSKVPHTWQQFWMGHIGDIEAVYTVNRQLPPEKKEEMRENFKTVEQTLSTRESQVSLAQVEDVQKLQERVEMLEKLLISSGQYVELETPQEVAEQLPQYLSKGWRIFFKTEHGGVLLRPAIGAAGIG